MARHPAQGLTPARDYFGEVRDAGEAAANAAGGWIERDLRIAGQAVRLQFAGPALLEALFPPLAHLAGPAAAEPIVFSLWDSASTGIAFPPVPWSRESLDVRGQVREEVGPEIVAYHNVHFGGITLYDTAGAAGLYWVESAAVIPWYERGSPLRTALHLALPGTNRHLIHAGAVGLAGGGLLIGGRSGSGKSTVTLACVEDGFGYAGDDYVLVTLDPPVAHGLYTTAKVNPDGLERLPALGALVDTAASSPDKAVLDLSASAEILLSVPISAVVIPRVRGDGPTELLPLSAAEAFRALSPSTVIQMPHRSAEVLETTARLLAAVPSYRLELGEDLSSAVALLRDLVGGA